MNERPQRHENAIQRIIRSRGGEPVSEANASKLPNPAPQQDRRDYVPFTVDPSPRMGFTIYHYAKDGALVRHDVMFHEMKHRRVTTHDMQVLYSFDADGTVFQFRGGQNMYELANAIMDGKLHTVYVYNPIVWPQVNPGVEVIDRISIITLKPSDFLGYGLLGDDEQDEPLPGEHPLSQP